ncbi:MAG: hypothetical protein ABL977_05870 [Candidatus Eisenbacteria bacterium]
MMLAVGLLAGCGGRGEEPNAFADRAYVRILPPSVHGPELEVHGTARDAQGRLLADRVFLFQLEAPDAGLIEGRLRTDEFGRYGVHTVFPRSRGGNPALLTFEFGDPHGEPYQGSGVIALATPSATGTAANGLRPELGADSVYRLIHDLKPGYNGPRVGLEPWDPILERPRRRPGRAR